MKFIAKVREWAGLPFEDLTKLLNWQFFGTSNLEIENPNLLVAKATTAEGEPVAFMTAEPVMILNNYAPSPTITGKDAQQIGDSINTAIEAEARKIGAGRFFVVLPDGAPSVPGEFRVVEQRISQEIPIAMQHGETVTKRLSCSPDNTTADWVN